ncbi:MAG: hypothetical protein NC548_33580 [Lachnospiraceae bacterium]|nr:hypothetical protein [Lachnospiraceae bacterium]MCM1232730.1 hypothetical protein [Ruminococcus flavefaciens]
MSERTSALYLLKGANLTNDGTETGGLRLDPQHFHICDMDHEDFGAWCTAHATWHYNKFSYLKHESAILVDCPMYTIVTASYMFIDNWDYYPKTFYAFVSGFEYVNDGCTKIFFDIDYVRTYWHLVRFSECFVEREHPISDVIGQYTLPEPIKTTSSWITNKEYFENYSQMGYTLMISPKEGEHFTSYTTTSGNLIALELRGNVNAEVANNLIQDYVEKGEEERIVNAYAVPASSISHITFEMNKELDGYTPKFNKCYTAQFNKCVLTDKQGDGIDLYFEYFSNPEELYFIINKATAPIPVLECFPADYLNQDRAVNYSIKLDNFPSVFYKGNNYALYKQYEQTSNMIAYVSNMLNSASSMLSSGTIAGLGAVSGNPLLIATGSAGVEQSAISMASNTAQYFNKEAVEQKRISKVYGNKNVQNTLIDMNLCGVFVQQLCQPNEYIQRIDDFFYIYGYRTDSVKIPNIKVNPHNENFNFVKTAECNVYGDCPVAALNEIQRIFNRGVTIWHNVENMLDYF